MFLEHPKVTTLILFFLTVFVRIHSKFVQIYQSRQDLIPFNSRILESLILSLLRKVVFILLFIFIIACNEDPVNSCETPTTFNIFNITTKTADVSWISSEEASYEIQIGISGFDLGDGQVFSRSETSGQIDDLASGTSYDFYVRAICASQNMSDWSEVQSFTTLPDCAKITGSNVTNITQTAAFISWQFSGDIPIGWIIEYAEEGFTPGTGVIAETSIDNIPLMNLMTNIKYEYYLTSKCVNDNLGERVGPFIFETL